MGMNDLTNRSDEDILKMLLSVTTLALSSGSETDADRIALMKRMEPVLQKCLTNMRSVESMARDLVNTKEDLVIERASSRRRGEVIKLVAELLCGDPYAYPIEIQKVALSVHKENGTLDNLLRAYGRKT